MGRTTHRILFGLILISLLAINLSLGSFTSGFYICSAALITLALLPYGKNGGTYHIIISTAGFIEFLLLLCFAF